MTEHKCGAKTALINGRTLREELNARGIQTKNISATEWVSICPLCDHNQLHSKDGTPLPFLAFDGVMRTVSDFKSSEPFLPLPLQFARFKFSSSALNSAFILFDKGEYSTSSVKLIAKEFTSKPSPDLALRLSLAVCEWGRGQRVWANLLRHNGDHNLSIQLNEWLSKAIDCNDIEEAIKIGTSIKGLQVSFASKHLRMIAPELFPVLDEVLSIGLGFALNPKGYALFQDHLMSFKSDINTPGTIADLEGAIFLLVRQNVRSNSL